MIPSSGGVPISSKSTPLVWIPMPHTVTVESGAQIRYDKLVIATGASPRTLGADGLDGVHVLRTMSDCLAIKDSLERGGPLVVVGGGFIGAEVASSARALGIDVTLLRRFRCRWPGRSAASWARCCKGCTRKTARRCSATSRLKDSKATLRVSGVRLNNGATIPADTVVVGIGVTPNTSWLAGLGSHR